MSTVSLLELETKDISIEIYLQVRGQLLTTNYPTQQADGAEVKKPWSESLERVPNVNIFLLKY